MSSLFLLLDGLCACIVLQRSRHSVISRGGGGRTNKHKALIFINDKMSQNQRLLNRRVDKLTFTFLDYNTNGSALTLVNAARWSECEVY
jgi:hypothetical protein